MLRVACPKCAKSLGLPDTAAGKSVKCPQCQQVFKAPATPAAAVVPKSKPKDASPAPAYVPEEATAYGLQEDKPTPEQLKKSAQGEEIDAMVIDAQRNRIRAKAWDKVGMPSKFVKRAALTACITWLILYLFMLMVIVLANHNMETADPKTGMIESGGKKAYPRYLFIQDMVREINPMEEATRPVYLWLYCTAALVIALSIYGLQLAGAESMKKLENYRLSMFSMLVGTFSLNLFAILGLLALMDKGVQYEFRVSQRRLEGKTGAELYDEDTGDDEEEDDEDDEDEEEEEEEEEEKDQRRPARRK
ncbi:MAG: hypothetical protein QM703_00090 [Gemmatales bacterium]